MKLRSTVKSRRESSSVGAQRSQKIDAAYKLLAIIQPILARDRERERKAGKAARRTTHFTPGDPPFTLPR